MPALTGNAPATPGPDGGAPSAVAAVAAGGARRAHLAVARAALQMGRTRVGLVVTGAVIVVALFGPLVAPHSPTTFLAPPFSGPSSALPLGADYLGRDVLSRVLHGGRTILIISTLATLLGVGVGAMLGLTAGYMRGVWDEVIMRTADVLLCIPAIVLALLIMSVLGPKPWLIVLAVALGHAPRTARVMRGAAVQLAGSDFITYAETLGERRVRILMREFIPNVTAPLTVEGGLRMTYSIAIVASLGFLGFGAQPPAAEWGLIINENRAGVGLEPWPVVVPVILIALLTIGNNFVTEGLARAVAGVDREANNGAEE